MQHGENPTTLAFVALMELITQVSPLAGGPSEHPADYLFMLYCPEITLKTTSCLEPAASPLEPQANAVRGVANILKQACGFPRAHTHAFDTNAFTRAHCFTDLSNAWQ